MDVSARLNGYRISARKARLVADQIRGRGVEDALKEIDGLTTAMLVTLGKNDIKTLEDFAGCAVDDLCGWIERKDGEVQRFAGALDEYKVSRADAEAMIMQARIKAGWVTEEELLAAQQEEEAAEGEGEAVSGEQEAAAEAPMA